MRMPPRQLLTRSPMAALIAVMFALGLAACGGGGSSAGGASPTAISSLRPASPTPQPINIPSVNGRTVAQAKELLDPLGIQYEFAPAADSSKSDWLVVEQRVWGPQPAGAVVTLTIVAQAPTPTAPSITEAAHQFALDVQAQSDYSVSYALLRPKDMEQGGALGPLVALRFDNTPKSFNEWQTLQDVLLAGDRDLLEEAGIVSYALAEPPTTILLTVRLDDAENVPGPDGHDYIKFGLTRKAPTLIGV
jgi:hypothetical protein